MSVTFAQAARRLVGTKFRAQGRDPSSGLDCVGLALATYGLPSTAVRRDYRIRGEHWGEVRETLAHAFRRISRARASAGDLVVARVAADQVHLVILTDRGFVHADLRLGKVVETPGGLPWPVLGVFRRRVRAKRG